VIEFQNVHKTYRVAGKDIPALHPTSLRVENGQVFGLIGHSGAGKSTLLRLINRLENPSGGQIIVDDEEVTALDANGLRRFRQQVGMIFQHFNLLSSKTVADNVALPLTLAGELSRSEIEEVVEHAAEMHWSYDGNYFFLSNNCAVESLKLLRSGSNNKQLIGLDSIMPNGLLEVLKGRGLADTSVLDDPREVIGAALKYLGYSVNSTRVPELRAARNLLRTVVAKRGFLGFDGGPGTRNRLLAGDIDLGQIYVGDLLQGAAENASLKVFLPREGTTISTDNLVLLQGAPNPALARDFIDTVLTPRVSAAISNYTYYGNPNAAARPFLDPLLRDNKAFNPSQADLKSGRVEFIEELPPGRPPRLFDRIWSELKSR